VLTRLGRACGRLLANDLWTNVYGLARTLLAFGTLGTLAFTSTPTLFAPVLGAPPAPHCAGAVRISLFCVTSDQLGLGRLLAIAILLVVASGWRPRLTALPHWWVAFSVQASISIPDGGDQITAVLALLLLPVALTDGRRWHWAQPPPDDNARRPYAALIAVAAMLLIRLQVAGVYLHASIAKLGVTEWADGTALYYWLNDPTFGTPLWLRDPARPVLSLGPLVAALTWGTIALEFALAVGLFLPKRRWGPLLAGGLILHAGIAVLMGLPSFALAMFGALILFLRPWERPIGSRLGTKLGSLRQKVRDKAGGRSVSYVPLVSPVAPEERI
jgi:antimicrobial peptide system SdpB family protein